VSVVVQLAGIPGSYQVLAESPSQARVVTVTSRAIALGYQEKLGKEVSENTAPSVTIPNRRRRGLELRQPGPAAPHEFTDGNTLNQMSDGDLIKIIADGGPPWGSLRRRQRIEAR